MRSKESRLCNFCGGCQEKAPYEDGRDRKGGGKGIRILEGTECETRKLAGTSGSGGVGWSNNFRNRSSVGFGPRNADPTSQTLSIGAKE